VTDTQTETQEGQGEQVSLTREEFDALNQRLETLSNKIQQGDVEKAKLEERIAAVAKPAPTEEPPPTREKLQAWVDDGTITEQQMAGELRRQERVEIIGEIDQRVEQRVTSSDHSKHVKGQYDAYIEANPELSEEGSDVRTKVFSEKQELMKLGMVDSLETEVVALRNVCGSLDKVRETTRLRREVHSDTGGGGVDSGGESPTGKGWHKGLSQSQIAGFDRGLLKGGYQAEDDSFFLKCVETARKQTAERAA